MNTQINNKWYDNKLVVYLLIVLFFPVGLYALWKNSDISKFMKVSMTLLVGVVFLVAVSDSDPSVSEQSNVSTEKTSLLDTDPAKETVEPNNKSTNEIEDYELVDLQEEIENFKTSAYDFSKFGQSKESLKIALELFDLWNTKIINGEQSNDPQVQEAASELRKIVERVQVKEFPNLRKSYVEVFKHDFWLENMEISVKGKGNNTLEFSGIAFASNRNIDDFQNTVSDALHRFRFKRVNYKTGVLDEYTYYDLKSKQDNEIK